jgi:hypothetical protein
MDTERVDRAMEEKLLLRDLAKRMDIFKGNLVCPVCGATMPKGWMFCSFECNDTAQELAANTQ